MDKLRNLVASKKSELKKTLQSKSQISNGSVDDDLMSDNQLTKRSKTQSCDSFILNEENSKKIADEVVFDLDEIKKEFIKKEDDAIVKKWDFEVNESELEALKQTSIQFQNKYQHCR